MGAFIGFTLGLALIAAARAGANRVARKVEPPRPPMPSLRLLQGGKD